MRRHHPTFPYITQLHSAASFTMIAIPFIVVLVTAHFFHIDLDELLFHISASGIRLLIAYVLATAIATLIATTVARSKKGALILPFLDAFQNVPTFALLPIAILLWGSSNGTIILFLAIIMMWPILFSIHNSLTMMKNDWDEALDILGVKGWLYFRSVIVPVSLPGLVTGSIIALAEGWEAVIAAEIISRIPVGLGTYFNFYSSNAGITALGILAILAIIFSINKLIWLPLLSNSYKRLME